MWHETLRCEAPLSRGQLYGARRSCKQIALTHHPMWLQYGFNVIAISIDEPALYDLQQEAEATGHRREILTIAQDLSTMEGQDACLSELSVVLVGKSGEPFVVIHY